MLGDEILAFQRPSLAIVNGIMHVLIARNTKDSACLELLGQRNDTKVEESQLSLVPGIGRILGRTSLSKGLVHFVKETFVPLAKDVPMLHMV